MSELLPAPFTPTMPSRSPSFTEKLMPERMISVPNSSKISFVPKLIIRFSPPEIIKSYILYYLNIFLSNVYGKKADKII